MNYRRITPVGALGRMIQCFWTVDSDDTAEVEQKIIPDGYTELIFHFGDPYRIRLNRRWELQAKSLVAGQIKKHFFLKNTGTSHIFGVKLKPSALTHLFGIEMDKLNDRVLDLNKVKALKKIEGLHQALSSADQRSTVVENFFSPMLDRVPEKHPVDVAVDEIFLKNGMITVKELADRCGFTERHLESLFKKFVGLSPKFLARIVRFSYIFQIISDNHPDWSDVVFKAGYYDQSHFIRNFKSFTGEDPSRYLFSRKDMANFFLKAKQTA